MSPEAQRTAIATACGIQTRFFRFWYSGHDNTKPFRNKIKTRPEAETQRAEIARFGVGEVEEYTDLFYAPNYPTDLNAIHAAVMSRDNDERWAIFATLAQIVPADIPSACGTAAQWSEAFLKALGLYSP